jgi:hypothetical protein
MIVTMTMGQQCLILGVVARVVSLLQTL